MKCNDSSIDHVISRLYEAAMFPENWGSALLDLGKPVNCHAGHLLGFSEENDLLVDLMCSTQGSFDSSMVQLNAELMINGINPRVNHAARLTAPSVQVDYMHSTVKEMKQNEFYQTVGTGLDTYYFGGLVIPGARHQFSAVGVFREEDRGHFTDQEIRYLQFIRPHFQRAMALMRSCRKSTLLTMDGEGLNPSTAVILLDSRGKVIEISDAAKKLIDTSTGVRIVSRSVQLADVLAQRWLDIQIKALIVNDLITHATPARYVSLAENCTQMMDLLVSPLKGAVDKLLGFAGVIYLIDRSESARKNDKARLINRFGLTDREAGLALALWQGSSLREYSEQEQLSYETAKYHLKGLFHKTSVTRQSALIRLLDSVLT